MFLVISFEMMRVHFSSLEPSLLYLDPNPNYQLMRLILVLVVTRLKYQF